MLEDLIRRLDDFDPTVRREAIIELGKTRNPAALQALANVVRNDPNPELRDLARKAGIYIRKESEAEQQRAAALTSPSLLRAPKPKTGPLNQPARRRQLTLLEMPEDKESTLEPAPLPTPGKGPVPGKKYNVPHDVRQRAKGYVEAALNDQTAGKTARAMKQLTEALSLDPNLINDGYFGNVAGSVTGLPSDEAIQAIVDRGKREEFIDSSTENEKQSKIDAHMATVHATTATDTWFELAIYALIVTIAPVLIMLVVTQVANGFITGVADSLAERGLDLPSEIAQVQAQLAQYSAATLVPVGFSSLIAGILYVVIQAGLGHLIATLMLRGHGTFQHLLTQLLRFYNRWLPILFGIFGFTLVIAFFTVGTDSTGNLAPSPIALCPVIILVIATGFVFSKLAGKIGEAYDFGSAMGCMTSLITSIVLGVAAALISYLIFQMIALQNIIVAPLPV